METTPAPSGTAQPSPASPVQEAMAMPTSVSITTDSGSSSSIPPQQLDGVSVRIDQPSQPDGDSVRFHVPSQPSAFPETVHGLTEAQYNAIAAHHNEFGIPFPHRHSPAELHSISQDIHAMRIKLTQSRLEQVYGTLNHGPHLHHPHPNFPAPGHPPMVPPGGPSSYYAEYMAKMAQTGVIAPGKQHSAPVDVTVNSFPTTECLYRESVPQSFLTSALPFEESGRGTVSCEDERLGDEDELLRYFLTHARGKPSLLVRIVGTHVETRSPSTHGAALDAEPGNAAEPAPSPPPRSKSNCVRTDFDVTFDLTSYVAEDWTHMVAVGPGGTLAGDDAPGANGGIKLTLRRGVCMCGDAEVNAEVLETDPLLERAGGHMWKDVLREYTGSKYAFKELFMAKEVPWDYDSLRPALMRAIRWTGYQGKIDITFEKRSYKVVAHSSSIWSKVTRNPFTWFLCAISCLWIVFLPLYLFAIKRIHGKLRFFYPMKYSGEEFYNRNSGQIVQAVMSGRNGVTILAA
ncbi:hypothetical protein HK101_003024 [Irineochytrium annulatum]|nr:hypothetical protein HK101_003024 [Irineochytrium annulatum]